MRVLKNDELELAFGGRDNSAVGPGSGGGGGGGGSRGHESGSHGGDNAGPSVSRPGPRNEPSNPFGGMGGPGGSNGTRVICTHFYRKGMLDRHLWRADLEYTHRHVSPRTVRGYQAWAIPYVHLMRRSEFAEKLMYPIAYHRARELAYKMGLSERGSLRGKLVRLFFEPASFMIGLFVGPQDWQALWTSDQKAVASTSEPR